MFELLIYTRVNVLREVGHSITKMVAMGEGYTQAYHWVIWFNGVEVYRHINLEA